MAAAGPADAVRRVEVVGLRPVGVELAREHEDGEVGQGLDEAGSVWAREAVEVAVEDAGEAGCVAEEDEGVGEGLEIFGHGGLGVLGWVGERGRGGLTSSDCPSICTGVSG